MIKSLSVASKFRLDLLPKLNSSQLDRLSEILGNLGLLLFASLVIPVFTHVQIDHLTILSGVITSVACIIGSLLILKGGVIPS